jgi:hypothetical protein
MYSGADVLTPSEMGFCYQLGADIMSAFLVGATITSSTCTIPTAPKPPTVEQLRVPDIRDS